MNRFFRQIPWRWVSLGVFAYAAFLVATLPAAKFAARLQTYNVQAAGLSGSIWHGRAAAMQVRGFSLGATEWHAHFLPLFLGRLSVDVQSKSDAGFINTNIAIGLGGTVTLHDLQAALPIAALRGMNFPGGWPNGWQGQLQVRFDTVRIENRWPTAVKGRLAVTSLVRNAPPPPQQLGDHNLNFSDVAKTNATGELAGTLTSSPEAPIDIIGTLRLTPNHTCLISALLKLRPNASSSLRQELEHSILPKEQGGWRMDFEFAAASF